MGRRGGGSGESGKWMGTTFGTVVADGSTFDTFGFLKTPKWWRANWGRELLGWGRESLGRYVGGRGESGKWMGATFRTVVADGFLFDTFGFLKALRWWREGWGRDLLGWGRESLGRHGGGRGEGGKWMGTTFGTVFADGCTFDAFMPRSGFTTSYRLGARM